MISLSLVGLILVVIGWALQFILMDKNKKIYASFVLLYSFGVAFLVLDGFNSGLNSLAWANLISFFISLAVLVKLSYK
jgi:predicted acyltransferase